MGVILLASDCQTPSSLRAGIGTKAPPILWYYPSRIDAFVAELQKTKPDCGAYSWLDSRHGAAAGHYSVSAGRDRETCSRASKVLLSTAEPRSRFCGGTVSGSF